MPFGNARISRPLGRRPDEHTGHHLVHFTSLSAATPLAVRPSPATRLEPYDKAGAPSSRVALLGQGAFIVLHFVMPRQPIHLHGRQRFAVCLTRLILIDVRDEVGEVIKGRNGIVTPPRSGIHHLWRPTRCLGTVYARCGAMAGRSDTSR